MVITPENDGRCTPSIDDEVLVNALLLGKHRMNAVLVIMNVEWLEWSELVSEEGFLRIVTEGFKG